MTGYTKKVNDIAGLSSKMAPEDAATIAAMMALIGLHQMVDDTSGEDMAEFVTDIGIKVMDLVESRSEEELELSKERVKIRNEAQRRVEEAKAIAKLRDAGLLPPLPPEAAA